MQRDKKSDTETSFEIPRRCFLAGAGAALAMPAVMTIGKARAAELATVKIENGTLQGLRVEGAVSFKGIPYAADTGGANRFMAPRPVPNWRGARVCFQFGDRSPQSEGLPREDALAWYNQTSGISENCCVLNVYTPDLNSAARRPVMFYIHGGGYRSGGSGGPALEGGPLAKFGDVVVVTLNHRLNVLGYLHLGHLDPAFADSANAGQLDILAALNWVKTNIGAFGGDPGRVTVFGQSGGGSKITALMVMPGARGLFHRAINMSGVTSYSMQTAQSREAVVAEVLKELGIGRADLRKIQQVPYAQLSAAHDKATRALATDDYRAVIDGRHILAGPLTPEGLAVNAEVPLIVGSTETEASAWLARDRRNATMTEAQLRARIRDQFKFDDAKLEQVIGGYRKDDPNRSPYQVLLAVATDALFRGRMLRGVDAKAQAGKAPVYVYNFAWRSPVDDGIWMSPHTADIPFAFGTMEIAKTMTGNDTGAAEVSRNLMSAFVAFARSGDPNNARMPAWKAYDTASRPTMVVNQNCRMVNDYLGGDRVASQAILHQESFEILAGPLFAFRA
jgi:para-nitrobenzyl esterase